MHDTRPFCATLYYDDGSDIKLPLDRFENPVCLYDKKIQAFLNVYCKPLNITRVHLIPNISPPIGPRHKSPEYNASVNSSCDHPPPGTVWGICNAYLSPRPGICSCVFARGPGICQYRVITPGNLSLTEKRPRPRVSFVVCRNGDY